MALYFVAEVGRGTGLTAYVYGPYPSVSAYHAAEPALNTVGNQNGYPTRAAAQAEANLLDTGSATTPTQNQPAGPPANLNTSPSAVQNRVKAAGGTVGNVPGIANPLDWLSNIGQFFTALTQPNLWLRIAKVLLGGVMVVAGLIKLTGTDKKVYGLAGMAAQRLPGV
jgi:hypothetical protein